MVRFSLLRPRFESAFSAESRSASIAAVSSSQPWNVHGGYMSLEMRPPIGDTSSSRSTMNWAERVIYAIVAYAGHARVGASP